MHGEILDLLRRFRRRQRWVRGWDLFLEAGFVATFSAGTVLLLDRLAFELGLAMPHLSRPEMVVSVLLGSLVLAAGVAAAAALLRPPSVVEIAWRLDRAVGGEECFLSAVEVRGDEPFAAALCEDAARRARRAEPARVTPRPPLGYRWGMALALAAGAALWAFPPRLYKAPVCDFEAAPLRGPAPLEVIFQDSSVGAIREFLWDFGDGKTGRGERVAHRYEQPGLYTARLRLRGPGGTSEKSRSVEVIPSDRAFASFEAEPLKGRAPLEVRFRNHSRNAKQYEWDFGDGVRSADPDPAHSYERPGRYTVRLRAANDLGSDVRIRENYVRVAGEDEPIAEFRALPREGEAPLRVEFEDLSSGAITEWSWDFGDPYAAVDRLSRDRNPVHLYKEPGRYTVRLRVKGSDGEDEQEKVRYIHVTGDGPGKGAGGGGSEPEETPMARFLIKPGSGGAGKQPGQDFGEKPERPPIQKVSEMVTPHAPGGELVEKSKVYARTGGSSGKPEEVPYSSVIQIYIRAAEDSINRENIPPAMRDLVRKYYESIRPK